MTTATNIYLQIAEIHLATNSSFSKDFTLEHAKKVQELYLALGKRLQNFLLVINKHTNLDLNDMSIGIDHYHDDNPEHIMWDSIEFMSEKVFFSFSINEEGSIESLSYIFQDGKIPDEVKVAFEEIAELEEELGLSFQATKLVANLTSISLDYNPTIRHKLDLSTSA